MSTACRFRSWTQRRFLPVHPPQVNPKLSPPLKSQSLSGVSSTDMPASLQWPLAVTLTSVVDSRLLNVTDGTLPAPP